MDKKKYFDSLAHKWEYHEPPINSVRELISCFGFKNGMSVLDAATGRGLLVPLIKEFVGESGKVVAIDFAYKMISKLPSLRTGKNVEYIQADVHQLPFTDMSFDRIICFNGFPHFADKAGVIKEFYRTLAKGGRFYIAHLSDSKTLNEMHSRFSSCVKNDIMPSKRELEHLFLKSGIKNFKVIEKEGLYIAEVRKN